MSEIISTGLQNNTGSLFHCLTSSRGSLKSSIKENETREKTGFEVAKRSPKKMGCRFSSIALHFLFLTKHYVVYHNCLLLPYFSLAFFPFSFFLFVFFLFLLLLLCFSFFMLLFFLFYFFLFNFFLLHIFFFFLLLAFFFLFLLTFSFFIFLLFTFSSSFFSSPSSFTSIRGSAHMVTLHLHTHSHKRTHARTHETAFMNTLN